MAIREFLTALAGEGRPVVIFLDDLQWSDTSTLDLIKYLMGRNAVPRLLIVGAYRDNEVSEGHPLMAVLRDEPREGEARILKIHLSPLETEAQNLLLAETLRRNLESTRELSEVLYGKSGGNPFYLDQALLSLSEKGAYSLDRDENRWTWDMAKIRDAELGANVIEFLTARLRELPETAISALKAAGDKAMRATAFQAASEFYGT